MQAPPSIRGALAICASVLLVSLMPAASATATSSQAEIDTAVDAASQWIRAQQSPDGSISGFGGDWSATALAAAGVDASAVQVSPTDPSLQDFVLGEYTETAWTVPSFESSKSATDYQRATLVAHAAGLDTSRLSADSNLPAQIAGTWNGSTGSWGPPSTNGTVFGILAMRRSPLPNWALRPAAELLKRSQHDDGGWTWSAASSAEAKAQPSETDMTGSAVAALCEAGVPTYDPTLAAALEYLRDQQIEETGAFEYIWGATNGDVVAWVVSGLNACGIDPQSAEWTTGAGKTPIDYLLSLQETEGADAGSFEYSGSPSLYTTQNALRALAGAAFTATPPSVRATPSVADGTPVPHALAIHLGTGNVRMCRVTAPAGASLLEVLAIAEGSAMPAGCVSSLAVTGGEVTAINGVAPEGSDQAWLARLDRGTEALAADQPVGFGELIALRVGARPSSQQGPEGPAGPQGPEGPQGPAAPSAQKTWASLTNFNRHRSVIAFHGEAEARIRIQRRVGNGWKKVQGKTLQRKSTTARVAMPRTLETGRYRVVFRFIGTGTHRKVIKRFTDRG